MKQKKSSCKQTQMNKETDPLAQMVDENLNLSPKKRATFLKQAHALRRNLALRQKQQKEREETCTPSK